MIFFFGEIGKPNFTLTFQVRQPSLSDPPKNRGSSYMASIALNQDFVFKFWGSSYTPENTVYIHTYTHAYTHTVHILIKSERERGNASQDPNYKHKGFNHTYKISFMININIFFLFVVKFCLKNNKL